LQFYHTFCVVWRHQMTEGCFQRVAVEYWSTKCNHCKILSSGVA